MDPIGPDVARLAALDADLLDARDAAAVRAAADADPAARAVLDALAATRAELAVQPVERMPADVAARIRTSLDHVDREQARSSTWRRRSGDPRGPGGSGGPRPSITDPGRTTGLHRPGRYAAVLTTAAAVLAVVAVSVGVLVTRMPSTGSPSPVLALRAGELAAAGPAAIGAGDLGGLADPVRRSGCLREIGVPAPDRAVLGGRQVVLDGRPGVLLVLPTGILGTFRLVVVDPDCGPDGGILLADEFVPR
ncbi:hypothetical protein [Pseudonocardia sp. H11422]|uniref:hypothetical protein n=1 Tax=Pseudonocardia sp. H11422 TaxID=2835866 RepID=UPI001BDCF991|nr:hypothetical protein [Pseudonocardia sp. H11422]